MTIAAIVPSRWRRSTRILKARSALPKLIPNSFSQIGYVPAGDRADPLPATTFASLDATEGACVIGWLRRFKRITLRLGKEDYREC